MKVLGKWLLVNQRRHFAASIHYCGMFQSTSPASMAQIKHLFLLELAAAAHLSAGSTRGCTFQHRGDQRIQIVYYAPARALTRPHSKQRAACN